MQVEIGWINVCLFNKLNECIHYSVNKIQPTELELINLMLISIIFYLC